MPIRDGAHRETPASILIVDRSVAFASLLERIATQYVGNAAIVAACGSALEVEGWLDRTGDPALAVIDVEAQDGQAFATAAEWRSTHLGSTLVATIDNGSDEASSLATAAGADYVIEKPYHLEDWRSLLTGWLSRSTAIDGPAA